MPLNPRRSTVDIPSEIPAEDSFGRALMGAGDATVPHHEGGAHLSPEEPISIGPGDVLFNRYRMLCELGRGGMGIVYLAQDSVLDIKVALKFVPRHLLLDTQAITNLKKEVLRGMALTHANIVRVYGFEQEGNTAIIVMEYVEGESLAQRKNGSLNLCFDVDVVRPWLEQLCAALDYAHHDARIAHRDLKPGNLLITPTGRIKITDFGLSATLSESRSRVSSRLGTSGTPAYMSPQQALGEVPSHLDDIYALGATLFELLTGTPPFFRGDVIAQLLHSSPVPIASRREEHEIHNMGKVPEAWERMIAACLAKDPKMRPTSGAAILRLLDDPARGAAYSFSPIAPAATAAPVAPAAPVASAVEDRTLRLQETPKFEPVPPSTPEMDRTLQLQRSVSGHTQHVEVRRVERPRMPIVVSLQPLVTVTSALVRGVGFGIRTLFELLMAVLSPLLKIAAALAVVWGLLHLKQKWDAGAPQREAAAAAERRAAEANRPPAAQQPAPPTIVVLPPPPPPGQGLPPLGQGSALSQRPQGPPGGPPPPPPPHHPPRR